MWLSDAYDLSDTALDLITRISTILQSQTEGLECAGRLRRLLKLGSTTPIINLLPRLY